MIESTTFPFSPGLKRFRTECTESIVIFIQLFMHGAPARSLRLMLLHTHRNGRGWREKETAECIGMLMVSGIWMIGGDWTTKAWLACKYVSCMKDITISCAIYQEKLYANGDISSSHWVSEHFAALQIHWWLMCLQMYPLPVHITSGWQHTTDIRCFQVQYINERALVICSWNNNVPSWSDSFSSKTLK